MIERDRDMTRQAGVAIAQRTPVRSCAGCQARDHQGALLRLALVDGCVTVDPRRRLPGRGAYVHRRIACVERAARRGGLARAFRTQLPSPAVADPAVWLGGELPVVLEVGPVRAGQSGDLLRTTEGERS